MAYYWKKKTIVSFILALLVIFIHTSAFDQYSYQLAYEGIWKDIGFFAHNVLANTFARVAVPLFFIISGATFFRDYRGGVSAKE